jgi:anti-sigma factor RsiW
MSDPMSEKLLREVLRASPRATWWSRCPDERHLAAFVDQKLPPERRSRLESHLARCTRCSEAVGLVAKVQDASPRAVVPGFAGEPALWEEGRQARGTRWWVPVTAAIA